MDETMQVVLFTLAAAVAVKLLVALLLSGGDFGRVALSIRSGGLRILSSADVAAKVQKLLTPPPPEPVKPSGKAVRLFAVLQREGRLLDFLLEDIQALPNGRVGTASAIFTASASTH